MSTSTTLANIRRKIRELTEPLDSEAPLEELVEVGTALTAIVASANDALGEIKKSLRDEAREELQDTPGSTNFDGLEMGRVSITIPKPKLSIVSGTDPEVLRRELGNDFDLYFETKTTYVPRKNATDMVARMATGRTKDLLLCSLVEKDQTPRVSFRKV